MRYIGSEEAWEYKHGDLRKLRDATAKKSEKLTHIKEEVADLQGRCNEVAKEIKDIESSKVYSNDNKDSGPDGH